MVLIQVPIRYLSMQSNTPEDNIESNIKFTETSWELNTEESALILVDVWNKHHIRSHLERSFDIINNKIKPVIQAARRVEMTIIHAPSPEIAKQYPQWVKYASEKEINPRTPQQSDWPPLEFRKREEKYVKYVRLPVESPPNYKGSFPDWWHWDAIAQPANPQPDDFVVATGNQLHRLLRDRKILHLLYAGFATNICVKYRDYGMNAMNRRGYNLILLRDCTTGIESNYTTEGFLATRLAIHQIEWYNSSTTSDAFLRACEACQVPRK